MKLTEFLKDVGRPVAYYPGLKKITGSTTATIFLCQFIYWIGKGESKDGAIYKTSDEIEKETGLSYEEQKTARTRLKYLGILTEKYARIEHTIYFKVDTNRVDELWASSQCHDGIEPMPRWGTSQCHDGERANATMGNEPMPCSLNSNTETTTETTQENTAVEEIGNQEFNDYPEGNPFYLNKQNMGFQDADLLILDRVYTDVTGMFPSKEIPRIRQAIKLIAEKNNFEIIPANESKIADILRPYYLAMLKRKNKNGQNYSRSGLFWLFEWAATGEIPQKQDETQKPDDITKRYKPVAEYKI